MRKNKKTACAVYNKISDWVEAHRNQELMERFCLDFITENIPIESKILDVGCGTGSPIAKFFIERGYKITGVDASEK
ncbi:class I SAM-dependent methyltransferase [Legionella septentrionalis]|uniref:class I SAM-dependent methyltransferase n=1 Tax=Legionella septentrionalis TaxID=2498109 RepID=UPI001F420663|nr:class I SAM-dependent methyltransferase [Legionella septentrionalis]